MHIFCTAENMGKGSRRTINSKHAHFPYSEKHEIRCLDQNMHWICGVFRGS